MDIDLRLLRYALTLAEHRNFARAAVALEISQPALTRSMQNLERSVGAILFDRRPQGVDPTDAGQLLLLRARELLAHSEEFANEVSQTNRLHRGRIVCGAGPYPAETVVASAVVRFSALHPGVQIELLVRNWDVLLQSLRAREIDAFIAETSLLEGEHDLSIIPLGRHPLYFAARPAHPLAGKNLALESLLDYPLAVPARIPPRLLAPLLKNRAVTDRRQHGPALPAIECASLSVLKRIVLCSDAFTVLTLSAMRDELADGRLVVLHTEPWLHLDYGIVRRKNRSLPLAAEKFLTLVQEEEAELARAETLLRKRHGPGRHPARIARKHV
jgi:DNA-binding transcriptional LysR family regulator